jgi:hypothetical protein
MIMRKEGPAGWMVFNNPARHNAVSLDMWEAVPEILEDFAQDDAVRVVANERRRSDEHWRRGPGGIGRRRLGRRGRRQRRQSQRRHQCCAPPHRPLDIRQLARE